MATPLRSLVLPLAFAIACGSTETASPDLPKGWEGAKKVNVIQFETPTGDFEGDERIDVRGAERQVLIVHYDAPFRPAQDVEGFARESDDELDVLVQPIDMGSDDVHWGHALHELHILVETNEEQEYTVTLYRRGDDWSGVGLRKVASAETSTALK